MWRWANSWKVVGIISQVSGRLCPPEIKPRFDISESLFGDGPTAAGIELDDYVVDNYGKLARVGETRN